MRASFADLERLLEKDPERYRVEIERLRVEDRERFEEFVQWIRKRCDESRDEKPMTQREVDELLARTAEDLGWSSRRVMAEALLRLRSDVQEGFVPFTPDEGAGVRGPRARLRRHGSLRAFVLGEAVRGRRVPR